MKVPLTARCLYDLGDCRGRRVAGAVGAELRTRQLGATLGTEATMETWAACQPQQAARLLALLFSCRMQQSESGRAPPARIHAVDSRSIAVPRLSAVAVGTAGHRRQLLHPRGARLA